MKIFAILFGVYILGLSCIPCPDNENCKYEIQTTVFADHTDHSNHDSDTENCSPFCVCACCGQFITNQFNQISFDESTPAFSPLSAIYTSPFFSEVYLNIWQPPKIS